MLAYNILCMLLAKSCETKNTTMHACHSRICVPITHSLIVVLRDSQELGVSLGLSHRLLLVELDPEGVSMNYLIHISMKFYMHTFTFVEMCVYIYTDTIIFPDRQPSTPIYQKCTCTYTLYAVIKNNLACLLISQARCTHSAIPHHISWYVFELLII